MSEEKLIDGCNNLGRGNAQYSSEPIGSFIGSELAHITRKYPDFKKPKEGLVRMHGGQVFPITPGDARLAVFIRLQQIRTGFRKGCRAVAAGIYADLLRANGVGRDQVALRVEELGRQCRPPLSRAECASAIKSSFIPLRGRLYSYATIANKLDVSLAEAKILSAITVKPFPPSATFAGDGDMDALLPERITIRVGQREQRRAVIQEIIQERKGSPLFRELKDLLTARGIRTSHITVRADLLAMGLFEKAA